MIPLLHDLSGSTVLVFGGGSVGARKARRFAREADVVVVSPTFVDEDFGGAELVRAAPDADTLDRWFDEADPALVVAATDDAAHNDAIEAAANERDVLVNRTDEHGGRSAGSVVVPATVRDDPVVVAVSTGGQSPALSRYLRRRIEADIDGAGEMATLTGELREELQRQGVDPAERRAAIRAVVGSGRVWKHLDSGRSNGRQAAEDVISDVTSDVAGDPS
jgi:precorrin-2 dehydrogenase/sirohydrochlorin ferrochelatase